MMIISAELSGKSKATMAKTIRTEGYTKCSQGQSVDGEIIHPRGRAYSCSRKGTPIPSRNAGMQDKKLAVTFDKANILWII
jgi:hypothetical protein|tara:strand:- start:867 stop:1109 length:243 start_codon:yes stop_codon:yes gene_type:complete